MKIKVNELAGMILQKWIFTLLIILSDRGSFFFLKRKSRSHLPSLIRFENVKLSNRLCRFPSTDLIQALNLILNI